MVCGDKKSRAPGLPVGEPVYDEFGDQSLRVGEIRPSRYGEDRVLRTRPQRQTALRYREPSCGQLGGDLPGGPVDERQHERVEVRGCARQVEHADQLPVGIGDRAGCARRPAQGIGEVLWSRDHGRTRLQDRGPDGVGPGMILVIQRARRQFDLVQQAEHVALAGPSADDVAAGIRQQDPDARAFQLLGQARHDWRRRPRQGPSSSTSATCGTWNRSGASPAASDRFHDDRMSWRSRPGSSQEPAAIRPLCAGTCGGR